MLRTQTVNFIYLFHILKSIFFNRFDIIFQLTVGRRGFEQKRMTHSIVRADPTQIKFNQSSLLCNKRHGR